MAEKTQWQLDIERRTSKIEDAMQTIPGDLKIILHEIKQLSEDHHEIKGVVDNIGADVAQLKFTAAAAEKQADNTTQKRDGTKLAAWAAIFLVVAEYAGRAVEWLTTPKPPTH